MKRGLKVKSGVRAPAAIVETPGQIMARNIFHMAPLVGLPECPNNKPGDGCWYCNQRGAK
jgi:hypothetical protein